MVKETRDRVTEKIDEISKSISNAEPGSGAEKNLVNNMVALAKLEQEDEKQSDIRSVNEARDILETSKVELDKSKFAEEMAFKKLCEDNRASDSKAKMEYEATKQKDELAFKMECEENRKQEAETKADQADAELELKEKELDFKKICEVNRHDEAKRKADHDYLELKFKNDELNFKKECERNRHEEAMAKIEAERAEAEARRNFEERKLEQEDIHKKIDEDSAKKERLINAARVGFTAALGVASLGVSLYMIKAACTVDKDFDAMPSKTLGQLMIKGVKQITI